MEFLPDFSSDHARRGYLREDRLELHCQYLWDLAPALFDFAGVALQTECGTIGCAMGHAPAVFPNLCYLQVSRHCSGVLDVGVVGSFAPPSFSISAEAIFGVPRVSAERLFSPGGQAYVHPELPQCGELATPREVATMLRKFIELAKAGEIAGLAIEARAEELA